MAWLPPELDIGLEPELKPLEPDEFELEPVEPEPDEPVEPEPEPDEVEPDELEPDEPVEPEPDEVEPEPDDEFDEPELAEVPDEPVDAEEVLCVDPGRARATAPAVTTLAMVTAVVAERTLARPFSLAATARRMRSRCALLMYPSCGHLLGAPCTNLLGQL